MGDDPEYAVKPEPPTRPPPALVTPSRAASPAGGNALASLDELASVTLRPKIQLDREQPWLYTVAGTWSSESVEQELYGVELRGGVEKVLDVGTHSFCSTSTLFPDLLQDPYRCEFHAAMERLLARDLELIEDRKLKGGVKTSETFKRCLKFWAARKDIRAASGHCSYFDAFMATLHDADASLATAASALLLDGAVT